MVPFTYADRINARKLMTTQFSNLSGSFTTLRTKYRELISRSLGELALRQAGVDDVAVAGSSIGQFRMQDTGTTNTFYTGQDLSSITDSTTMIGRLAESMAVAEFMILGGGGTMDQSFSSTLHVELGSMSNCIFDSMVAAGVSSANKRFALVTDAHQTGSYMQLVQFTRYYRAISSCVFELVRKIKEKQIGSGTLFDRTLITLHSEFNRSARDAGDGADHGPNGSCYSIISGMVPAPIVVGNIKKDGGSNNYRGTWGNGAPMVEFTNQQAVVGNAVSTVAMMLGVPSPAPNNASFVSLNPSTGKVSPAVGLPRNIA
jgi:hypothetical protein